MRKYWDRIFEYRMRKQHFGPSQELDQIFLEYPEEALEFVHRMAHAIEPDDGVNALVGLEESVHESGKGSDASESDNLANDESAETMHKFQKFVLKPCNEYILFVSGIFESLDFDLQLKKFISEELIENLNQNMFNKNRAYLMMCRKVIQETDRYVHIRLSVQP